MISDIIEKRAFDTPYKIFLEIEGQLFNYSQFNNEINAIVVSGKIPKTSKNIAIRTSDVKLTLLYLFACNRLEKTPVLFPPHLNNLSDYTKVAHVDFEIKDNNCIIQQKYKSKYIGYKYKECNVQCILFTSGTSSKLKGVELTFGYGILGILGI